MMETFPQEVEAGSSSAFVVGLINTHKQSFTIIRVSKKASWLDQSILLRTKNT